MFGRLLLSRTMDKELETDMNKIITVALMAGGLLILDAPEAAAHNEGRISYQQTHYQAHLRQRHQMPYWLKRDRAFRHWYKNTRLRRHKHLTWHRLFETYRWETVDRRKHRRADRVVRKHEYYRHHDRDERRRHRH
jgi:hypothetical protein